MHITSIYRKGILLLSVLVLFSACSGLSSIRNNKIQNEMNSIISKISRDRGNINLLQNKRIGKTGFFYIIDLYGRVVFHPQKALIGSNFKKNKFIDKIISERSGCVSYSLGKRTQYVFFKQLNDLEILCLSILGNELSGSRTGCYSIDL